MTTRQCDQCDRPFYAKGLSSSPAPTPESPRYPTPPPIAPVLVRGVALTLHAHHADDLLDMVLPDGWRDVIEEGRAA